MKNFRLSKAAEADLTDIWAYKAEFGEAQADELVEKIVEQLVMLTSFPEAGRKRPEIKEGLRSFAVERHVILYRLTDQDIEVVRIIYGTRDINSALSEDSSS